MKQAKMSDDVHRRLLEYADGRPLGKAIERLLNVVAVYDTLHLPPDTHQANTTEAPRPDPSPGLDAPPDEAREA